MPAPFPKPCNVPGCGRAILKQGKCPPQCPRYGKRRRRVASTRPNANARGYGHRWRLLSKSVLAECPVCQKCNDALSTDCDHILPKSQGGTDDRSNLQALCGTCHKQKTAAEDGGFGNPIKKR